MKKLQIILSVLFLSLACNKTITDSCEYDNSLDVITQRNFLMGFSTWCFGPWEKDKEETYQFISQNSDIYSEQIDYKIPWQALINNTAYPQEFLDDINFRLNHRINNEKLVLSVSLLNTARNDLAEDFDGSIPQYDSLDSPIIEDAYFKYLQYLISKFNPDFLVYIIEINEMKIHSGTKWEQLKTLSNKLYNRLKTAYPDLPLSSSITLHNWFDPAVSDTAEFIEDITNFANQNRDFVAISFYPYFKGLHTKSDFQKAFDFLHSHTTKPVAFVETAMIAEDLEISSMNVYIKSDVCQQKDYLESLMLNAYLHDYLFVIWWAYRDFDILWNYLPEEYKDLAKIWRDTGLLDEKGRQRPAYKIWEQILLLNKA